MFNFGRPRGAGHKPINAGIIQDAIQKAPINILIADLDFVITYANEASLRTLKKLEHVIPVPPERVVGSSMDVFHRNPKHQRAILADPANLPYKVEAQLGEEILELDVCATYDEGGNYKGSVVAWSVLTEKLKGEQRGERINLELLSCAEELRASAKGLVENAESVAGGSERTLLRANSVTELSTTAACSTEQMAGAILEISNSANELSGKMAEVVTGAQRTAQLMQTLRTANEEISRVSETISDIADQTNLLALNATIEAASAGEAGRGFAVVASEVKDLARETMLATDQINSQVRDVNARSQDVAQAIDEIAATIEAVDLLTTTLSSSVRDQSSTTEEIAVSIAETAAGAQSISKEMKSLAEASSASPYTSQGLVEAAEQLLGLAHQLST